MDTSIGQRTSTRGRGTRGRSRGAAFAGVALLVLTGCAGGAEEEPPTGDVEVSEPADDGAATDDGTATEGTQDDGEGDDAGGTGDLGEDGTDDDSTDDGAAAGGTGDDGEPVVMVGTTSLGEVLVDAEGMTLYMFEPDAQGESTCYDTCATNWPPLVVAGEPAAGDGADDSLLGTVERTDGSQQVTYDGWPLYHWAQDAAAGDVTGQGVNDVWWVLDAEGQPVREG